MCRTLGLLLALYDYERLLRIVFLSSYRRIKDKKLIKPFVPEQQSLTVSAFVLNCIWICVLWLIMIMAIQQNFYLIQKKMCEHKYLTHGRDHTGAIILGQVTP